MKPIRIVLITIIFIISFISFQYSNLTDISWQFKVSSDKKYTLQTLNLIKNTIDNNAKLLLEQLIIAINKAQRRNFVIAEIQRINDRLKHPLAELTRKMLIIQLEKYEEERTELKKQSDKFAKKIRKYAELNLDLILENWIGQQMIENTEENIENVFKHALEYFNSLNMQPETTENEKSDPSIIKLKNEKFKRIYLNQLISKKLYEGSPADQLYDNDLQTMILPILNGFPEDENESIAQITAEKFIKIIDNFELFMVSMDNLFLKLYNTDIDDPAHKNQLAELLNNIKLTVEEFVKSQTFLRVVFRADVNTLEKTLAVISKIIDQSNENEINPEDWNNLIKLFQKIDKKSATFLDTKKYTNYPLLFKLESTIKK